MISRLIFMTGWTIFLIDAVEPARILRIFLDNTIEVGGRKISVDYDDIFFFETSGNIHKIILHALDRQIEFSGTMKELAGTLGDSFVRCHRSFLVNKNNIMEIDAKNRIIYFTNGETCLMSTRMMKGL